MMNNIINLLTTPLNLFLIGILAVIVAFGLIGIRGSHKGPRRGS